MDGQRFPTYNSPPPPPYKLGLTTLVPHRTTTSIETPSVKLAKQLATNPRKLDTIPMARASVVFVIAALLFVAMVVAPMAEAKSSDAPSADAPAPAADAPADGPSGPAGAPGPQGVEGLSGNEDDDDDSTN